MLLLGFGLKVEVEEALFMLLVPVVEEAFFMLLVPVVEEALLMLLVPVVPRMVEILASMGVSKQLIRRPVPKN